MLKTSLSTDALVEYLGHQIQNFFPDGELLDNSKIASGVKAALERYEACIKDVKRKYFTEGEDTHFNHLHSDQNAMFLYLLSREFHLQGENTLATKTYYLNKALHSIDVMFDVELPEKFLFSHCVGTVLGKAEYGNYFQVGQNCTVGNEAGVYPVIGEGVALYKGSTVVGGSQIGSNVHVAAHSVIRAAEVPSNVIAFGQSPNLDFKEAKRTVKEKFFTV